MLFIPLKFKETTWGPCYTTTNRHSVAQGFHQKDWILNLSGIADGVQIRKGNTHLISFRTF